MKNLPNYEKALKAITKEYKKIIDVDTVYNNRARHCELYKQARNADDETKTAILAQIKKEDDDETRAYIHNATINANIACLKQNAKLTLFNELTPAIIEYLNNIKGKQYGEKTAEKLRQYFIDNFGVSVSVYKRHYSERHEIGVNVLDKNGFSCGAWDLEITPCEYDNRIIDNNNCVVMENLTGVDDFCVMYCGEIIENVPARVKELRKLKDRAIKELNTLRATVSEFNKLKPETIPELPYISASIHGDII